MAMLMCDRLSSPQRDSVRRNRRNTIEDTTAVRDLVAVVQNLMRSPEIGGCPWTKSVSTSEMLSYLRSEVTETAKELEVVKHLRNTKHCPTNDATPLESELGDIMFDTLMLIGLCARDHPHSVRSLSHVCSAAASKVKGRTPYMKDWGDGIATAASAKEAMAHWQAAKRVEKASGRTPARTVLAKVLAPGTEMVFEQLQTKDASKQPCTKQKHIHDFFKPNRKTTTALAAAAALPVQPDNAQFKSSQPTGNTECTSTAIVQPLSSDIEAPTKEDATYSQAAGATDLRQVSTEESVFGYVRGAPHTCPQKFVIDGRPPTEEARERSRNLKKSIRDFFKLRRKSGSAVPAAMSAIPVPAAGEVGLPHNCTAHRS